MGPAWEHRFLVPDDEPDVLALFQEAFAHWPPVDTAASPTDYFHWKLSCKPAQFLGLATTSAGRIIGVRLFFAFNVMLRGKTYLGYQPVDAVVHPSFRRKGVMEYMRRVERESPVVKSRFNMFALKLHIRTWNPAMQKIFRTLGEALETSSSLNVFALDRSPLVERGEYSLSLQKEFDQRSDVLWNHAAPRFELAVVRDAAHLNWRYADARAGNFQILTAECNGALAGYAVGKVSQGVGYIADLLAAPTHEQALRPLIAAATELLLASGAGRVECWLPGQHAYADKLRNVGFKQRKPGPRIRVTPYAMAMEDLLFLQDPSASIYMTIGDTDLV